MPPVPASLLNAVRIGWQLTEWCNYECAYCPVPVFHRRTGKRQSHAFDYYPVEEWLEAFRRLPYDRVGLRISGGEPFLDRKNLSILLNGLLEEDRFFPAVYTNGFWDPRQFDAIRDKSRVHLLPSFHPSQTDIEGFLERILRLRDAGFSLARVNVVLAPENLDSCGDLIARLLAEGIPAYVTPMVPGGVYTNRLERDEKMVSAIEKYVAPVDAYVYVLRPVTLGEACYHPAISYGLNYDGEIRVRCSISGQSANFLRDPLPALPRESVPCPHQQCIACPDMIRSIINHPLNEEPLRLLTEDEFAEGLWEHWSAATADPASFRRKMSAKRFPETGQDCYTVFQQRVRRIPVPDVQVTLPAGRAPLPLPDVPMWGYLDHWNGTPIVEATAGERIMVSGWAASTRPDLPVDSVEISAGGAVLATFRGFGPRPDVAAHFSRMELLNTGFGGLVCPPKLRPGDYALEASARDRTGLTCPLEPLTLRVTG